MPELQTPDEMLERWRGVECQCDSDTGYLCEICHDIEVVRDLIQTIKLHESLQEASRLLVRRMEALGLDNYDPRVRNFWQRTAEAANL